MSLIVLGETEENPIFGESEFFDFMREIGSGDVKIIDGNFQS